MQRQQPFRPCRKTDRKAVGGHTCAGSTPRIVHGRIGICKSLQSIGCQHHFITMYLVQIRYRHADLLLYNFPVMSDVLRIVTDMDTDIQTSVYPRCLLRRFEWLTKFLHYPVPGQSAWRKLLFTAAIPKPSLNVLIFASFFQTALKGRLKTV